MIFRTLIAHVLIIWSNLAEAGQQCDGVIEVYKDTGPIMQPIGQTFSTSFANDVDFRLGNFQGGISSYMRDNQALKFDKISGNTAYMLMNTSQSRFIFTFNSRPSSECSGTVKSSDNWIRSIDQPVFVPDEVPKALEIDSYSPKGFAYLYGFISMALISLASFAGLIYIPLQKRSYFGSIIDFSTSLAIGALLSSVLLVLLPQALNLGAQSGFTKYPEVKLALVCIGVVIFYVIEHFITQLCSLVHKREAVEELESLQSLQIFVSNFSSRRPSKDTYNSSVLLQNNKIPSSLLSSQGSSGLSSFKSASRAVVAKPSNQKLPNNNNNGQLSPRMPTARRPSILPVIYEINSSRNSMNPVKEASKSYSLGYRETTVPLYPTEIKEPVEQASVPLSFCQQLVQLKQQKAEFWLIFIGELIGNFLDGVSLGSGFTKSIYTGVVLVASTLCEAFPQKLGDFAIFMHLKISIGLILFLNFIIAIVGQVGVMVGVLIGMEGEGANYIFAITSGIFLYITLVKMMPELSRNLALDHERGLSTWRKFILQLLGIFLGLALIASVVIISTYVYKV